MISNEWLEKCAQAGEFLYGVYPAEVLLDLYETRDLADFTLQEMIEAAVSSPAIMMEYVDEVLPIFESMGNDKAGYFRPIVADASQPELQEMFKNAQKDGNPYADLHVDPEEWSFLLKDQGDVAFYIPDDEDEIVRMTTEMYIGGKEMEAYVGLFDDADEGMDYARQAWWKISAGVIDGVDASAHLLEPLLPKCGSISEINKLMPTVTNFYNNINLRSRRGWAPAKLSAVMYKDGIPMPTTVVPGSSRAARNMAGMQPFFDQMGVNLDLSGAGQYTSYGSYGEKKNVKIYPNDPCPCGSGLKYKKCCGRKGGIKAAGSFQVKL